MTDAEVEAVAKARSLLSKLESRFQITEELRAEIDVAERGLWAILFPGSAEARAATADGAL